METMIEVWKLNVIFYFTLLPLLLCFWHSNLYFALSLIVFYYFIFLKLLPSTFLLKNIKLLSHYYPFHYESSRHRQGMYRCTYFSSSFAEEKKYFCVIEGSLCIVRVDGENFHTSQDKKKLNKRREKKQKED